MRNVVRTVVAETPRLVLTTWAEADVEPLAAIGTAEVVRYLGGTPWTTSTARESIDLWGQANAPWLRFDFVIEIGWTLAHAWWRRGFATEAARAALEKGVGQYGAERIVSKCSINNTASEAVMHRIGMRRVGVVRGSWPDDTVVCRLA